MKPKIGIYVQDRYDKPAYKVESFNVRKWFGMEVIKDVLDQDPQFDVGFAHWSTVDNFDVILVSITSAVDWYSFIAERVKWGAGKYKVIIGGAGVDNVRPFLEYADVFVFGRGEAVIIPLLESILSGQKRQYSCLLYTNDFDIDNKYFIRQAEELYPRQLETEGGYEFEESGIGCPRKCFFCQYTWARELKTATGGDRVLLYHNKHVSEKTMFDLDLDDPTSWLEEGTSQFTLGLDGSSERLRRMINKPITREMFVKLVSNLKGISDTFYRLKLFNIVGYPTETDADWEELEEDFTRGAFQAPETDGRPYMIELLSTPFKPMPATPVATWPVSKVNYRYKIKSRIRPDMVHSETGEPSKTWKLERNGIIMKQTRGTEGLATIMKWVLCLRGTEAEAEGIRKLAVSSKLRNASSTQIQYYIQNAFDMDKMMGAYSWKDLPTRYLHGTVDYPGLERASRTRLEKYGGVVGKELSEKIGY